MYETLIKYDWLNTKVSSLSDTSKWLTNQVGFDAWQCILYGYQWLQNCDKMLRYAESTKYSI